MFNNASILGTSGLVIMAKWIPKMIHFHPYSINGSPFRPNHGDWFSTKGVAYARLELKGFNLHLFCTHMHAQYDDDEDITDQYSIHRVCQSYELAKYINLMACSCSSPSSKDLIILAGDMNTSSRELPYRLLVELTGLADCYKYGRKKKSFRKKELALNGQICKKSHLSRLRVHHCSDESSDEEMITCGHKDNTFTKPNLVTAKSSKRIDFILYKLRDLCKMNDCCNETNCDTFESRSETTTFMSCLPEQVKINAKDVSGLSYSDHQPVAAKLNFLYYSKTYEENEVDDGANCDKNGASSQNKESDSLSSDSYSAEGRFNKTTNASDAKSEVKGKKGAKLKQKDEHAKHHPQWKQAATNNALSHQLQFSSIQPAAYSKLGTSNLIHDIENLLADYINASTPFKHLLTVGVVLLAVLILLVVIYFTVDLTSIEMVLISIILLLVSMFALFLRFVTHRHEMNAVKAILNDICKKKSFSTDYGLFESE